MKGFIKRLLREGLISEKVFTSIDKNEIGGLDFKGDDYLNASVYIEDNWIDLDGNRLPLRNMDVYRIDAPMNPDNIFKRVERQGYGTSMMEELIDYCKGNGIDYIGSKSLNDKSYGLFYKFEKLGKLAPFKDGLHKRTCLWKIN